MPAVNITNFGDHAVKIILAVLPLRNLCGKSEPGLKRYANPLEKFTSTQFFMIAGASKFHKGKTNTSSSAHKIFF